MLKIKTHLGAQLLLLVGFVGTFLLLDVPKQLRANNPPPVTKFNDTIVDQEAIGFHSNYGFVNVASYQQDAIITYNGWQYVTYYKANRYLAIARRQLPDGQWQVRELDHALKENDAHNVAVLGISPSNGRIHLAFDHHNDPLNYIVSIPGVATNPATINWHDNAIFSNIQHTLGGVTIDDSISYPRFFVTSDNQLQLAWREGSSGNGRHKLAEYSNETWKVLGPFTSASGNYTFGETSVSRNAYFNGFAYGNGRLHASWTWRERFSDYKIPNHDVGYAYSDDNGLTWKNNEGINIATTGTSFINIDSPGHVVGARIPVDRALLNQEGFAIDAAGRPHVLVTYVPTTVEPEPIKTVWEFWRNRTQDARAFHYWQDDTGAWNSNEISGNPPIINGGLRPKLVFDSNNDAYAVLPNLRIASASAASGWTDWTLVYDADDAQFYGEIVIDKYRLQTENVLSIMAQEKNDYLHQPTAVRVLDFQLGVNETSVSAPVSQNKINLNMAFAKPTYFQNINNSQPLHPTRLYGPANLAVDGDLNTLWVAGNGMNEDPVAPPWPFTVDLDGLYTINQVQIEARPSYGPHCLDVLASVDGVIYTPLVSNKILADVQGPHIIGFSPTDTRFVKLMIKSSYDRGLGDEGQVCVPSANSNDRTVQIKEFAVFGTRVNLAFLKGVDALSQLQTQNGSGLYGPANYAVDGLLNTTWVSGNGVNSDAVVPPWSYTIDLDDSYAINKVEISSQPGAGPHCLDVLASVDGVAYTEVVANKTLADSEGPQVITFPATTGRYVRLFIKSSYDFDALPGGNVCDPGANENDQNVQIQEIALFGPLFGNYRFSEFVVLGPIFR